MPQKIEGDWEPGSARGLDPWGPRGNVQGECAVLGRIQNDQLTVTGAHRIVYGRPR